MGPMLGTLLPAPMLAGLADAVRAIGSGQFHVRLLDALSGLAAWHNRMVMRYPRYAAPDFLFDFLKGVAQCTTPLRGRADITRGLCGTSSAASGQAAGGSREGLSPRAT